MRATRLTVRSLLYYWRTNLAVVAGVATAVAVLSGALLVGDSVRGSLRALVVSRLGNTGHVIASAGFFREQLAAEIDGTPLIMAPGFVTAQESGRRAGDVRVYGVDARFWRFHGVADVAGPDDRAAFVSPALAEQLSVGAGQAVLVRVERPTDVPLESVHGRRDDVGRTLRLTVARVLPPELLGEFSLEPQQAEVRAVYVPLARVQQELEVDGRINAILVGDEAGAGTASAEGWASRVRARATLEDMGLRVRAIHTPRVLSVEADAGLLDDGRAAAVRTALEGSGLRAQPVFAYLANAMRLGAREVPYSLVAAIDLQTVAPALEAAAGGGPPPIVLNQWAAGDLGARPGDRLTLDYYAWEEPGRLATRSAEFTVAAVVPIDAGDRDLVPMLRGISDSTSVADWDPPFPIDLRRIRPVDEEYWEQHRTTPKAYVPIEVGQRLWGSRYGALTSLRIAVPVDGSPGGSTSPDVLTAAPALRSLEAARADAERRVRAVIDPLAMGIAIRDVRGEGLGASRGATDFGAYFVYFSFFLVVSALLLAALFFKLGVEQRGREVGLLRAVGFGPGGVRRMFLREGLVLAAAGAAVGLPAAIGYAWLLVFGLRSWWVGAVGTTALSLHVTWVSLAAGAAGGIVAAAVCIWWTLRTLARISERALLAGDIDSPRAASSPRRAVAAGGWGLAAVAILLLVLAAAQVAAPAGAFFGAGAALLGAALCWCRAMLEQTPRSAIAGAGWGAVSRLGLRNATYRPGRSVLSIAVVASATFILIAVEAFRRPEASAGFDRQSGTGGYALLVETLLPIVEDPNTDAGRDAIGLFNLEERVAIEPLRLLPGDDASCLNLYEPRNPRIVAPRDSFLEAGRFAFQDSLASTDAERANPWLLLRREEPDGAIPVIADANSMTYVLHRQLGDEIAVPYGSGVLRLRLVAALRDSVFQSEMVMSEANFVRLFPGQEGYRVLLVDAPGDRVPALTAEIENALVDFGGDAIGTAERLARFHRVENTYLSTFQTLGGLGLLLGTIGLGAVLLRNVFERRREIALLGAVGYRPTHFLLMVVVESALLLGAGMAAGAISALIAIAPAAIERGARLPVSTGVVLLLVAVVATGLLASAVAARAAMRGPLLQALRSD